MAVRIYTLAKELNLDSKELVELCTRAGIQDKGSALASMTDEEVVKLKDFMASRSKPAERQPPAQGPLRPSAPGRAPVTGKPPVIAPKTTVGGAPKASSGAPSEKPAVVMRPLSGPLGAARGDARRPVEGVPPEPRAGAAEPPPQAPIAPLPPPPPPVTAAQL